MAAVKATYDNPTAYITLSDEKLKNSPPKPGASQGCPLSQLLFNTIMDSSHSNQIRRRNKRINIGRKEVKLSLFTDGMILNTENSKVFIKKLLELRNKFNKVCRYSINMHKYIDYLIINHQKEKARK